MEFAKIFNKVLFKSSSFSSNERFSKALFQSKIDIAFLTFSIFTFLYPRPLVHLLEAEVHYVNFTKNNTVVAFIKN